ncbi:rhamnogalacturonase-like protein [Exidia glandulosa HHB12029]|uniref:Rhamnogalacturonase-like protein n=1 Tax=Exidia glandulosa HHB12029 TaxID=1314781 RepID=A0A165NSS2_EXIGL|nr:rhamnogalacturonase-like protein [Exidia glandulosa HHB12029]
MFTQIVACALFAATAAAQLTTTSVPSMLTRSVGPTTSHAAKRAHICNVLDYGGSIGSSDIGPAITSAYNSCVTKNAGSTFMKTWVTLNGGKNWAIQLDGFITRTSTTSGHMFAITNATDFEFYSANSAGGIQGNGYQCRNAGPRLIRVITSTSFSVHDLVLVDSPEFHLIIDNGSRGEVYNLAIRGAAIGGSDGIDVSGDNHWVHDVMVTNQDECVTIKSPASNFLVERIWCNRSGGCAFGSLNTGVSIKNIVYRNIYTNGGNQAMMLKSNGGSGTVSNILLDQFQTHDTAYGLYINSYWSSISVNPGNGVTYSGITFSNWNGNVSNGTQRAPVSILCPDANPCTDITLKNVNMWSKTGSAVIKCESAYGTGACLRNSGSHTSYTVTSTITKPAGYTDPPTLPGDLASGFNPSASIPTPTIPSTYFPGLGQISPLMRMQSTSAPSGPTSTSNPTTTSAPTSAPTGGSGGTAAHYGQCGGIGWTGPTACESPYTCVQSNEYYSQCL